MECYSATKNNQILPFAITWIHLKGITLSEMSQTDKDRYSMIPSICRMQNINYLMSITSHTLAK